MDAARRFLVSSPEFRVAFLVTCDALALMMVATVIRGTEIYLDFLWHGDTPYSLKLIEFVTWLFVIANFVAALIAIGVAEVVHLARLMGRRDGSSAGFSIPPRHKPSRREK